MTTDINRKLLRLLKEAIPSLPDHCTRLELIIENKSTPIVKVDFYVRESPEAETQHARFELKEITP